MNIRTKVWTLKITEDVKFESTNSERLYLKDCAGQFMKYSDNLVRIGNTFTLYTFA